MKLNQIILLGLFCLCSGVFAHGQSVQIMNAYHQYKPKASTNYHDLLFLIRNSLEKKVDGDAFLMDWEDALLFVDDQQIYSVRARYRLLDDEFQLDMNGTVKAIYPHLIKGIVFKDRVFVSGTTLREDGQLHGFYELLVSGDVPLLKKYTVDHKVKKDDLIEIGDMNMTYHFCGTDGFVEAVVDYQRQPHAIFETHQEAAKDYWKTSRLRANKEADLRQFFAYCNQL